MTAGAETCTHASPYRYQIAAGAQTSINVSPYGHRRRNMHKRKSISLWKSCLWCLQPPPVPVSCCGCSGELILTHTCTGVGPQLIWQRLATAHHIIVLWLQCGAQSCKSWHGIRAPAHISHSAHPAHICYSQKRSSWPCNVAVARVSCIWRGPSCQRRKFVASMHVSALLPICRGGMGEAL